MNTSQILSRNQQFLSKVTALVHQHLSNEQFGVRELAEASGVSRSLLHKKIKKLSGKSVSQFIRELRLDKAREMLLKDLGNVSEIAYQVGFSSPTYFNTCFKEYFGYPPGEAKFHPPDTEKVVSISKEPVPSVKGVNVSGMTKNNKLRLRVLMLLALILVVLLGYTVIQSANTNKASTPPTSPEGIQSIAVLPFKDMSEEGGNGYFCDGVMESVLDNLSQFEDLRIISRVSVERYKNTDKNATEIAAELGVSHLLEGGVLKSNNRVRIFVRLVNAGENEQIWSESYDRDISDLFEVQSEISGQIIEALKVRLSVVDGNQINPLVTRNMEAYDYYLRGRDNMVAFMTNKKDYAYNNALINFNKALEIDSMIAPAYADLAQLHWVAYDEVHTHEMSPGIGRIAELAQKALALNPNLPQAHAMLGISRLVDNDFTGFREHQIRALELNPNYALANYFLGMWHIESFGDYEGRVIYLNKALTLDPYSSWTPEYNRSLGTLYLDIHAYEQAEHYIKRFIELDPSGWHYLNLCYLMQGKFTEAESVAMKYRDQDPGAWRQLAEVAVNYYEDYDRALELYAEFYRQEPNPAHSDQRLGLAHWLHGDKEKAMHYFSRSLEEYEDKPTLVGIVYCYDIAGIYATIGEIEKALEMWRNEDCVMGVGLDRYSLVDALYKNLWENAEFKNLVQERIDKKTVLRNKVLQQNIQPGINNIKG